MSDDNVIHSEPIFAAKKDAFGFSKNEQTQDDKKAKEDKFEHILDLYFFHLNTIFVAGGYFEFMDTDEIIKMAEIKLCTITSTNPRIGALSSLFDKVVMFVRKIRNPGDVEKWLKLLDDAVSDIRYRNTLSALDCPIERWSERNAEGKVKAPILNAIVSIRAYLERRKLTIREDIWKSYSVITNTETDKEEYVSVGTDQIIREWRNSIYERKGTMYPMEILKDAYHQIAKHNEFHSLRERIKAVAWDGIDRYQSGAQAFGLATDDFTVRVLQHHLIASQARIFYPGVWYDLVLCVFGDQGAGKTTGLRILYGRDNVISCNFFELDPKRQSEATRHGISCVENADTFGDARKADFNRIKADISIDSFVGRDAYGRLEDMRRVNITYVIWYTGNEQKVLRDPTGNRRFPIVYSIGPIDEDWLRLNSAQLWAQAYKDMEQLRSQYLKEMRRKGIAEEYPKYLELPKDLWEEARKRQDASMVESPAWEDWVPELIFQNFVVWPSASEKKSMYLFTRDILKYLNEKCPRNASISSQALSKAMSNVVLLEKAKCDGLMEDIKWSATQINRNGQNLRGYRIDFEGESRRRAFEIIKEFTTKEKDPTEAYVRGHRPM